MKTLFGLPLIFSLLLQPLWAQTAGMGLGMNSGMNPGMNPGMANPGMYADEGMNGNFGPQEGSYPMGAYNQNPQQFRSRQPGGDFAYLGIDQQCPFERVIPQNDQTLLSNANRALSDLANREQCRPIAGGTTGELNKQVEAYRVATGTLGPATPYEAANVTCANYRDLYNAQYAFYLSNWNATYRGTGFDVFGECRNSSDRDEGIECAGKITGELLASKNLECRSIKTSLEARGEIDTRVQAYQSALQAFQAVLNNDDCLDLNGSQTSSLIQTGLSVASRASTLGLIGSAAGPLIGLGTELIGALVSKIFKKEGYIEKLAREENFTKLACLYNNLEHKAKRCDRELATREVARRTNDFKESDAYCSSNRNVDAMNSFLDNFSNLITRLQTPPPAPTPDPGAPAGTPVAPAAPAPTLSMAEIMNLTGNMTSTNFPGTDQPIIDVASSSVDDVLNELSTATADIDATKAYLQSRGQTVNPYQVGQKRAELLQKKEAAESVKQVLDALKTQALTGNTDEATRVKIQTALQNFSNGGAMGNQNFVGVFNEIMLHRSTMNGGQDSLAKSVASYNSRVQEFSRHSENRDSFSRLRRASGQAFEDNNDFDQARAQLQVHLEKKLQQELSDYMNPKPEISNNVPNPLFTLRARAMNQSAGPLDATDPANAGAVDARREIAENFIKPILRACNQLQSAMSDYKNAVYGVCKKFDCSPNGKTPFAFPEGYNQNNCATNSDACYNSYRAHICQQTSVANFEDMRSRINREFLKNGKICNMTMAEMFGGK